MLTAVLSGFGLSSVDCPKTRPAEDSPSNRASAMTLVFVIWNSCIRITLCTWRPGPPGRKAIHPAFPHVGKQPPSEQKPGSNSADHRKFWGAASRRLSRRKCALTVDGHLTPFRRSLRSWHMHRPLQVSHNVHEARFSALSSDTFGLALHLHFPEGKEG